MPSLRTITIYTLIGIMVVCIGALAGWYFVLRSKSSTATLADSARGFGNATPSAGINGSNFDNSNTEPTNTTAATEVTQSNTTDSSQKPKTPRLWHITKTPVAGSGFGVASSSFLYYAERVSGYVFRVNIFSGELFRLSNTLRPMTYEALFNRNGSVLMRSVNSKSGDIETFYGTVASSTSSSPGTLQGVDLEKGILDLAINPDISSIFYTVSQSGAPTIALTSAWNGSAAKRIFTSPIGSWKPLALSDGRHIVVQKPEDGAPGYAYEVTKEGVLTKLVGPIDGLSVLPLSNSRITIYSSASPTRVQLFVQEGTSPATLLPVKTIAEKCVWSPYSAKSAALANPIAYCAVPTSIPTNFVEKWNQGSVHSSDSWWRINTSTGEAKQIYSPAGQGVSIDVVDPQIDPSGTTLSFRDNNDQSLWSLRISE